MFLLYWELRNYSIHNIEKNNFDDTVTLIFSQTGQKEKNSDKTDSKAYMFKRITKDKRRFSGGWGVNVFILTSPFKSQEV